MCPVLRYEYCTGINVYTDSGSGRFELYLDANGIRWYNL